MAPGRPASLDSGAGVLIGIDFLCRLPVALLGGLVCLLLIALPPFARADGAPHPATPRTAPPGSSAPSLSPVPVPVTSVTPVVVAIAPGQTWPVDLTPRVELYEDPSGNADFARIAALPSIPRGASDRGFAPIRDDARDPGYGASSWWIRFTIDNASANDAPLRVALVSPWLHYVDFYVREKRAWRHTRAGTAVPLAEHDPALRNSRLPAMRVSLSPMQRAEVYIRISGKAPAALTTRLYSQASYDAAETRTGYVVSGLIGAMLFLAWGMLVISMLYRNWTFVCMAVGCAVQALDYLCVYGYARIYLWPASPQWAYRSPTILGLADLAVWTTFIYAGLHLQTAMRFGRRGVIVVLTIIAGLECWAWFGDISVATQVTTCFDVAVFVGISWLTFQLYRHAAPTAGLMLSVMLLATFNFVLQIAQAHGHAPVFLERVSLGITPEPAYEIFAIASETFVLAAWVRRISQLHTSAVQRLADWQREEEWRLRREVAVRTLELEEALLAVEEKNRQKTEMLAFVGHDLRAPLATIAGYVKHLGRDKDGPDMAGQPMPRGAPTRLSRTSSIAAIERSIGYQLSLIDELLEFSRGELQPLQLRIDDVRIGELLEEIADHAVALSAQHDNRLILDMDRTVPAVVRADGNRLRQVLLNLLSNAAKFTRRGTITLDVRVRVHAAQAMFRFLVADTGEGIDPQAQQDIFRAFHQIERSRGGVGLGLHIAERILRQMHSGLHLSSTPGAGSRFSFDMTFPLVDATPHRHASPTPLPDLLRAPSGAHPPATHAPPSLPVSARAEVLSLAAAGRLSDLEDWLDATTLDYPAAQDFCAAIREALERLDFERIVDIAGSRVDAA